MVVRRLRIVWSSLHLFDELSTHVLCLVLKLDLLRDCTPSF